VVRQSALWRSAGFALLLLVLSENLEHVLEGLRRHTTRTLAVPRRSGFELFVGHWIPSCDLLLTALPDFCKRSSRQGSGNGRPQ
jgi:hypothetical protein